MSELQLSLAEWSLHRMIEGGQLTNLDFPRVAREEFDIGAVELVNVLMEGHDARSLEEFKRRADDHDVRTLLIMCDDEGDLSAENPADRRRAAENHFKWIDAVVALGGHAIRVNTGPEDEEATPDLDSVKRCAESCERILEYAQDFDIDVLIENHGGISSRIDLVLELLDRVPHQNFGTLPDFGNFPLEDPNFDPYAFVEQMMPRAKAVSAKCFDILEVGSSKDGEPLFRDSRLDLVKMLDIIRRNNYRGYLGIEYEGDDADEFKGIRLAKKFLEQIIRDF